MARILVAEDEAALRGQIVRTLEAGGNEVVAAADGGQAIDLLTHHSGQFDLLLADIKMPVMDGIALALVVARDYPHVVILLMTGFADQRERACGLNSLIRGVVTKPFGQADLVRAIAEAVAGRQAG
jgi:two-component system, cell cycle response regulator CpdR